MEIAYISPHGSDALKRYRKYLIMVAVFLVSLAIRLWLLDRRWINPDEGAHLVDAALLLEGNVPAVDYGSRQPFYVLMVSVFLKLFGINYTAGRLLPLTCSMLTGVMLFLIGRGLFREETGILSALIYWMLPLELVNSVVVKMQSLVVLLTCISLYGAVLFYRSGRELWLVPAGVFAGLAFYVRESALVIPVVILGFAVFACKGRPGRISGSLAMFMAGYAGLFAIVLGWYGKYMSVRELLTGSLSPLGIVHWAWTRVNSFFLPVQHASARDSLEHAAMMESKDIYNDYALDAAYLHLFLLAGLVFSALFLLYRSWSEFRKEGKFPFDRATPWVLVYLWVFLLFLAYAFFFFNRGFFIDYSRELLPPLVVIFCAWLCRTAPAFSRHGIIEGSVLMVMPASALIFLFQSNNRESYGTGHHLSLAIVVFTLIYFMDKIKSPARRRSFILSLSALIVLIPVSRIIPALQPHFSGTVPSLGAVALAYAAAWLVRDKDMRCSWTRHATFLSHSVAAGLFVVSIAYSGTLLNTAYDAAWSPRAVEQAVRYLETHTRRSDEVLSGAVIWEFQARRRLFQKISHPLSFEYSISEDEADKIRLAASLYPPRAIILDGYTERTYLRQIPWLNELVQEKYILAQTVGPAIYPVRIYLLKSKPEYVETTSRKL